jgi:iron(II)-dependent oxidoreductase
MNSMHVARPGSHGLLAALIDARNLELELFEGVTDSQLLGKKGHFLEPPIWEIGHVGWFQEYWILRKLDGAPTLLSGSDGIYDSFNVPYRLRWDHRYPSRRQTLDYIAQVLERTIGRIESREPSEEETYFYTLATLHEDMHAENLTHIFQTLAFPQPKLSSFEPAASEPPVDGTYQPRDVTVPGGTFELGARRNEPFVFDNEKWAHPVVVGPFRISSTPVTNAQFQAFVDSGGYRRRELWSFRGWDWRRRARIENPLFWIKDERGWCERRFDDLAPLRPWHPVACVSWWEAEAFCRWAHRRLPTEAEWEMAASLDPETGLKRRFPWGDAPPLLDQANLDYRARGTVDVRALPAGDSPLGCRQMIGNVWEWVADTFGPYPDFVCDPYKEYSEPYFGTKKVLKGGSWSTRGRLIRNTWRNFYMRHRRNIFAGFRTCAE